MNAVSLTAYMVILSLTMNHLNTTQAMATNTRKSRLIITAVKDIKSKWRKAMKEYNGHRSWNAWNVSLWLTNDEETYKFARQVYDDMGLEKAATYLTMALQGEKTHDGAVYTRKAIYEELKTWENENEVE